MDAIVDFNGHPAIRLQLADGSTCHIALQGAQVLSWQPRGRGEQLYLSPLARHADNQAVRGGVPIIFPQFAQQGPLPRHGLARTALWQLEAICPDAGEGYSTARFSLTDSPVSQSIWPYPFRLEMTVGISAGRLDMELEVQNTGGSEFSFTAALHTYLRVKEVEECFITGLKGCAFTDHLSGARGWEGAPELCIEDELDRLYHRVNRPLLLSEAQRSLAIHAEGFPDVVLWNPWEHKCAALPDMPDLDFRRMICIEAAAVTEPSTLAAGEEWWGRQTLICVES